MPSSRKVMVGVFVIGGLLLFAVGLFWIGDRRQLFARSIQLNTEFRHLSGLKNGSKVLVAGMEAGEVLAIRVPPDPERKFQVTFRVLERFRPILRTDSVASIQMDGLVGSKILQVEAGTQQGREIKEGDTIRSTEPVEISDVIKEAVGTVQQARTAIDTIRADATDVLRKISDVSQEAEEVIIDVGADVRKMANSGTEIAQNVDDVIQRVKQGQGTVGKLITDDRLYDQLRATVKEGEETVQNMRQTSDDMKDIVADVKQSNITGHAERTLENVRAITESGKEAMAALMPDKPGEDGIATSLRATLDNANQAMSNLAENMEALKRNWLFRGFFNKRGFFDMDAVSVADYQAGRFAPDRVPLREWIDRTELFVTGPDGKEQLSEQGKQQLDAVIANFLRYARNNPIMVEGYASEGTADEQFIKSLERADKVRTHLVRKFSLKENYVGLMPMGAVQSTGPQGKAWDGVAVVLFLTKDAAGQGK